MIKRKKNNKWNIYSNNFETHTCPILELSKCLIYNPGLLSNGSSIFNVYSKCNRFMLIFNAVIEENRWKIANVGVHVGELDSQQN